MSDDVAEAENGGRVGRGLAIGIEEVDAHTTVGSGLFAPWADGERLVVGVRRVTFRDERRDAVGDGLEQRTGQ